MVVYGGRGDVYSVSLPCRMRRLWPLLEGVLLERDTDSETASAPEDKEQQPPQQQPQPQPTLFSLMRPLEELKPLAINTAPEAGSSASDDTVSVSARRVNVALELYSEAVAMDDREQERDREVLAMLDELAADPAERIVLTSASQPLLVTYNLRTKRHSLWLLRQSAGEVTRRMETASPGPNLSLTSRRSALDASTISSATGPAMPITPELLMERVWQQEQQGPQCSTTFLAADADCSPLLCLFSTQDRQLQAWRLVSADSKQPISTPGITSAPSLKLVPAFELAARAVAPVHSSWYTPLEADTSAFNADMLVLERGGSLALYAGNYRLCPVTAVLPSAGPQDKKAMSDDDSIVALSDPVASRVTVTTAQGGRYRAAVPNIFNSVLVRDCMQALASCLPPSLLNSIRTDLIAARSQLARTAKQTQLQSQQPSAEATEWQAFASLIETLAGIAPEPRTEPERKRSAPTTDAWTALLSSEYHRSACATDALRLLDRSTPSDAAQTASAAGSLKPATSRKELQPRLSAVLSALHLVYEDLKMSLLSADARRGLATLLLPLACSLARADYADVYLRDCPQLVQNKSTGMQLSAPQQQSSQQQNQSPPPSILGWLQQRMSSDSGKKIAFPLFKPRPNAVPPPCQLTRRICYFYDVLSGQPAHASPAKLQPDLTAAVGSDSNTNTSTISVLPQSAVPAFTSPMSPFASPARFTTPRQQRRRLRPGLSLSSARGSAGGPAPMNLSTHSGSNSGNSANRSDEFPVFSPSSVVKPAAAVLNRLVAASKTHGERLVMAMVEEGFRSTDLDALPFGVALPLREALASCRERPPGSWPREAYELIGRQDLARMFLPIAAAGSPATSTQPSVQQSQSQLQQSQTQYGVSRVQPKSLLPLPAAARNPGGRFDINLDVGSAEDAKQALHLDDSFSFGAGDASFTYGSDEGTQAANALAAVAGSEELGVLDAGDDDGTQVAEKLASLRFGRDLRLKEVRRLLRSNRPVTVAIPQTRLNEVQAAHGDLNVEYQSRLQLLALRTLGQTVGRGMYTLASISPALTEALPIPALVLDGRLPPKYTPLDFEVPRGQQELKNWPSFHNGASAALRISPAHSQMTRTWIVYNRPEKLSWEHAGFLLALGLQGHLAALAPADHYWYLSQNHDSTTVAILLGMAAAKRGSMDTVTTASCLVVS